MQPLVFSLIAWALRVHTALAQTDYVQPVQDEASANLLEAEPSAILKRKSNCTLETAGVRKNWDVLSGDERRGYIRAVKCLLSSPAKTDPSLNTGTRVRFDDWAAQHINQTMSIHVTVRPRRDHSLASCRILLTCSLHQQGNFLTWHRHYIWSYEKALREECGYDGYLPVRFYPAA